MDAPATRRRRWQSATLLRLEEGDPLHAFWHNHLVAFTTTLDRAAAVWAATPGAGLTSLQVMDDVFDLPEIGPLGGLAEW